MGKLKINTENGSLKITTSLQISQTFEDVLDQLVECLDSENATKYDLETAVGEIRYNNVDYQIQLSLVVNKKRWCTETEIRFSELVKVHD